MFPSSACVVRSLVTDAFLVWISPLPDDSTSSDSEAFLVALVKKQLHVMEKAGHKGAPPKRFQPKITKFAPSDFHKLSSFHIQQPRA